MAALFISKTLRRPGLDDEEAADWFQEVWRTEQQHLPLHLLTVVQWAPYLSLRALDSAKAQFADSIIEGLSC